MKEYNALLISRLLSSALCLAAAFQLLVRPAQNPTFLIVYGSTYLFSVLFVIIFLAVKGPVFIIWIQWVRLTYSAHTYSTYAMLHSDSKF